MTATRIDGMTDRMLYHARGTEGRIGYDAQNRRGGLRGVLDQIEDAEEERRAQQQAADQDQGAGGGQQPQVGPR